MSILLNKTSKEKKMCYLAGDFNINLLQLEKKVEIENFLDIMINQNFTPLNNIPNKNYE